MVPYNPETAAAASMPVVPSVGSEERTYAAVGAGDWSDMRRRAQSARAAGRRRRGVEPVGEDEPRPQLPSSAFELPTEAADVAAEETARAGVGEVLAVLDARASQETAIRLVGAASVFIRMLVFTYDREDITEALLHAKRRGVDVRVGADKRWTLNGRTRDQLQRLQLMAAEGIEVRVIQGDSYAAAYHEVGRAAVGGRGLQHAKVVHTDQGTLIGSCNFTTASRANNEMGVEIKFSEAESESTKTKIDATLGEGLVLKDAAVLAEQRTRSATPTKISRRLK